MPWTQRPIPLQKPIKALLGRLAAPLEVFGAPTPNVHYERGRFIAVPASGATIRGYTADLLLVDEMAYLSGENGGEDVVVSILPMLKDNGQIFYASTPAGKHNLFAELFLEPKANVHRIKVPGTSIPRLASRVERLREQLSATRFRQEVLCEFLSDGLSYFDLSTIENATSQEAAICPRF